MSTDKIKIRYFEKFKGEKTLLFYGNNVALEKFAKFLNSITSSIFLNNFNLFVSEKDVSIEIEITSQPRGIKILTTSSAATKIKWTLSNDIVLKFYNLIMSIVVSDSPCHQYLDSGYNDDISVVVSKGEYDNL